MFYPRMLEHLWGYVKMLTATETWTTFRAPPHEHYFWSA